MSILDMCHPVQAVAGVKAIVCANELPVGGFYDRHTEDDYPGRHAMPRSTKIRRWDLGTLEGVEKQVTDFLEAKQGDHDGSMYVFTLNTYTNEIKLHVLFFEEPAAMIHNLRSGMLDCLCEGRLNEARLLGGVVNEYDNAKKDASMKNGKL